MPRFSGFVLGHKKTVIAVFIGFAIICALLSSAVSVNYSLVDYLPQDARSTAAIEIMKTEFGGQMPNARVMVGGVTVREALEYRDELERLDGVLTVSWLDDVLGRDVITTIPVEFLDGAILGAYYKDGSALIPVEIESGREKDTIAAIRALIGDENAVAGDAVNTAAAQEMSVTEVLNAMAILLPVITIILLFTTSSWIEPLLFFVSIGVAVLINMGTNIFAGETSFITQAISPILQLAVSLDYAIFLLHGFREFREEYGPKEAMARAMKKALSAIAASAATTVFGFLALMFMRFGIGADLGLNLVKGVALSFISVMVFLPALTLATYKLIDKTKHRKLIPDFKGAGKWIMRICVPFLAAALIAVVPAFLAQSSLEFMYGTADITSATRAGDDAAQIEEKFGSENTLVLLVPKGNIGKEAELCEMLQGVERVKSVVSYVTSVGAGIPPEYLDAGIVSRFYSENYARVIIYADMKNESAETFETVGEILDTADRYYESSYLAGQSATLYDMANTVSADTSIVNLCAVIGIFLVLLITYKSLSVPLILLFTIETAIWLNLSFAYFSGSSFNFIGYLVISTVQLGSTVDYAILLSDRYLENRRELPKKAAMAKALDGNLLAVLTSAAILATAGFTLAMTSSNAIISELGLLLGRGTLLSLLMVTCVLPAMLWLLDGVIRRTTLKNGFHKSPKTDK